MSGLGKLVRMLSSPSDGEALNAVRMLGKALARNGRDWHWLAALVDGEEPTPQQQHSEDVEDHQAAAAWILSRFRHRLRPKEADFLETMTGWLGDPTPKQAAWLSKLCAKYGYRS